MGMKRRRQIWTYTICLYTSLIIIKVIQNYAVHYKYSFKLIELPHPQYIFFLSNLKLSIRFTVNILTMSRPHMSLRPHQSVTCYGLGFYHLSFHRWTNKVYLYFNDTLKIVTRYIAYWLDIINLEKAKRRLFILHMKLIEGNILLSFLITHKHYCINGKNMVAK